MYALILLNFTFIIRNANVTIIQVVLNTQFKNVYRSLEFNIIREPRKVLLLKQN